MFTGRMVGSCVSSIRSKSSALVPVVFSYLMSSGSLACASIAQLTTFAILARSFGPSQFGLYVQFTAATTIAVQLCGLGASDCLIRRVSRDRNVYPSMLGHNVILVLATGCLLVVGGTIATLFWLRFDPRPFVNFVAVVMLLTSSIVITRLILLVGDDLPEHRTHSGRQSIRRWIRPVPNGDCSLGLHWFHHDDDRGMGDMAVLWVLYLSHRMRALDLGSWTTTLDHHGR